MQHHSSSLKQEEKNQATLKDSMDNSTVNAKQNLWTLFMKEPNDYPNLNTLNKSQKKIKIDRMV